MNQLNVRAARQVILPEVGVEGQKRIEAHAAQLPRGLSAAAQDAFLRYVRGAGQVVATLDAAPEDSDAPAKLAELATPFRHQSSRELALGCLAALLSIKAALLTDPAPGKGASSSEAAQGSP